MLIRPKKAAVPFAGFAAWQDFDYRSFVSMIFSASLRQSGLDCCILSQKVGWLFPQAWVAKSFSKYHFWICQITNGNPLTKKVGFWSRWGHLLATVDPLRPIEGSSQWKMCDIGPLGGWSWHQCELWGSVVCSLVFLWLGRRGGDNNSSD